MSSAIHDTLHLISTVIGSVCVLGVIVLVNFAFSRDKVITRTLRHQ
jgi:hypothetical protein